jgi:hypothetical protein
MVHSMKPDFISLAVTSVKRFRSAFATLLDMHQALRCRAKSKREALPIAGGAGP